MKIVRTGITRIVFVFKDVVVKVPNFSYSWRHFLQGLLANISENSTWDISRYIEEGDKSYLLCPVLWCSWGGWFLVMKRADRTLTDDEYDKCDISEHRRYFEGDDKVCNYGILSGRLVKLDYGQY